MATGAGGLVCSPLGPSCRKYRGLSAASTAPEVTSVGCHAVRQVLGCTVGVSVEEASFLGTAVCSPLHHERPGRHQSVLLHPEAWRKVPRGLLKPFYVGDWR